MAANTFKESTIISAFAETGLIPYSPEIVLGPLCKKLEKALTSSLPSSPTTESSWPTPEDVPDLHYYADNIRNTSEYMGTSSPFH